MIDRKAALFDLDGVLIDSEGAYTRFWSDIERIYPTGIADYARAIKGTALISILSHYPSEAVRSDIVARLHAYEEALRYEPYPGAASLLAALRAEGWAIAIVTSSDDTKMGYLRAQMPALFEAVDCVVTGSMVSRSKPDPEGYLTAARLLGCDPGRCVVFEDSLQGLAAGRAAGARVVALATTNPASAVTPLADLTAPTVAALTPAALGRLLPL